MFTLIICNWTANIVKFRLTDENFDKIKNILCYSLRNHYQLLPCNQPVVALQNLAYDILP